MGPDLGFSIPRNINWRGSTRKADYACRIGPNQGKWPKLGPESTVWAETWSRSMPGLFRSLWDGSNPLQGAVPAWSWRSKSGPQCRFGPESSQMARIGSRIDGLARNKDKMNPTACPDPSRPLLRPKTAKNKLFKENGPRRLAGGAGGPRFIGAPRFGVLCKGHG